MAVGIPDTFTAKTSEKYNLSIRISPDGFSFSGVIPSKSGSLFYREVTLDKTKDYLASLKEAFFAEECLGWPYRSVSVYYFTPAYLFVPGALFDEEGKQALMRHAWLLPGEQKTLSNALPAEEGQLVFGMEKEVYGFLHRSFINPRFIHHLTPAFNYWKKQSALLLSGQMYVVLNRKTIDICCFKRAEVVFFNSFNAHHADDVLYFIAVAWREAGLNQLKDRLFLFGTPACKPALTDRLHHYFQHVSDLELPADAYLYDTCLRQAPLDLILSVCE